MFQAMCDSSMLPAKSRRRRSRKWNHLLRDEIISTFPHTLSLSLFLSLALHTKAVLMKSYPITCCLLEFEFRACAVFGYRLQEQRNFSNFYHQQIEGFLLVVLSTRSSHCQLPTAVGKTQQLNSRKRGLLNWPNPHRLSWPLD